nr:unnamed protein product [Trichobilharzia regenti]
MIRSTGGGLPEVSSPFNKSSHDNSGQSNTANSLVNNNNTVTVSSSTCMTNSSTSAMGGGGNQSPTISSPMISHSHTRSNTSFECACRDSAPPPHHHHHHRSHHYNTSGVHFSYNNSQHHHHHIQHHQHHHHNAHKESYVSHSISGNNVNASSVSNPGGGGQQHSSSHYSTHQHHHHQHNASPQQHNNKHTSSSYYGKMKPTISKHLQEFMLNQWEQYRERLLQSNTDDNKLCSSTPPPTTATTTIVTTIATTLTSAGGSNSASINKFTFSDVNTNNNYSNLSNDIISSKTTSSSHITSNSSSSSASSTIESNTSRKVNDSPVIASSNDTTYTSMNSSSSSCCSVAGNNSSGYSRRKQNNGYGISQIGKSMSSGSMAWKRGQISGRKNSSPGNFNTRGPGNYPNSRNSVPTVTVSINPLPSVTCIQASTTTTVSPVTTESINPIAVTNQHNANSINACDTKTSSSTPVPTSITTNTMATTTTTVVSVKSSTSDDCCSLQQTTTPVMCSSGDSATTTEIVNHNSSVSNNSVRTIKLHESKSENTDGVCDGTINPDYVDGDGDHTTTDGQCCLTSSLQVKDVINMNSCTTDEHISNCPQLTSEYLQSRESLTISEERNSEAITSQDDCTTPHSVNGGKTEEGECYWTPDPPASPENSTAPLHGGNYSSSYHSTNNLSPSPQLSVSLPNSEDLQRTVYHPPLEIQLEPTSLPDIYRCNKLTDPLLICSSTSSRLESLNDVD